MDRPSQMDRPNYIAVGLRLDPALHQQIIAEAKRWERSLNGEMVYRLRRSFETQEQPKD